MIRIPTGNEKLDAELGGGLPLGSIVEVFGPPDCGKTQFATDLIRQSESDMPKLFIDTDFKSYSAPIHDGRIMLCQPETAERALSIVERLIPQTDIIIIDTVAALVMSAESDGETHGRQASMARASLLAAFLRRNKHRLVANLCILLLLNHEYEGHDTPGGKAVHEESDIRIRLNGPPHYPHYTATVIKNIFAKSKP